jgi:hypothetical protein
VGGVHTLYITFSGGANAAQLDYFQFSGVTNPVPVAPTALTASTNSPFAVALNWTDAATNETVFELERSTDNQNYVLLAKPHANATSFTDMSASEGTNYFYRLRSYNPSGWSDYSFPARGSKLVARITGGSFISPGTFRLGFIGWPDATYPVQASSDLVHWVTLGTSTSTNSTYVFEDVAATLSGARFYRVIWP